MKKEKVNLINNLNHTNSFKKLHLDLDGHEKDFEFGVHFEEDPKIG